MSQTRRLSARNVEANYQAGRVRPVNRFFCYGGRESPPPLNTKLTWIFTLCQNKWRCSACHRSLESTEVNVPVDIDSMTRDFQFNAQQLMEYGKKQRSLHHQHPPTMLAMDGYSVQSVLMLGRE